MYKLAIPVMTDMSGKRKAQYLEELTRAKADRVFLCPCRSTDKTETKSEMLQLLREEIPLLQNEGYEVGVWISSLGHGGSCDLHPDYQNIIESKGTFSTDSYCPLDEAFSDEFADWVAALAKTGPSMIMLDDDYRLGYRGGLGCFCPLHLKKVSEILGEKIDRETLVKKAMSGKPNRYRDAWIKANGDSLIGLAKKLRKAVDSVDPTIRLGHCAVLDTWDIDGVDSITLAKAFAGNTKPFLRFIGAAYWAANVSFGVRIQQIIELERMQSAWCKNEDIEIFSEGDVFPRPRHNVPSFYLEALDTALRADGTFDGILKYMIDYSCVPFYERGYIDHHVNNFGLYKHISEMFDGKTPTGVRIYDCMRRLRDAHLPEQFTSDKYISDDFIPASIQFLADNGIPMQHTERDVTVVFGENARHVPEGMLENGAILDAIGARILTERGFDVGITGLGKQISVQSAYYPEYDEACAISRAPNNYSGNDFYAFELKDGVEKLTEFRGAENVTFAYRYEDAAGRRYLVYPFEAKRVRSVNTLFRNYYMQSQLLRDITWVRRRPPDAMLAGSPDTYLLTKKDDTSLSVGIWNMFADPIFAPEILLCEKWTRATCIGCNGSLQDDRIILSDIKPYSMVFIELTK